MIDGTTRKRKAVIPRWLVIAALVIAGAIYAFASGRWLHVYAFIAQYPQSIHWAITLAVFVPILIGAFVKAWGVEDVPYTEEAVPLGSGRLHTLCKRIAGAESSPYIQAVIVNDLADLASHVVALKETSEAAVIRRRMHSGDWEKNEKLRSLICHEIPAGLDGRDFLEWYEDRLATIETYHRGATRGAE